jgi:DNA-binding CsgD family transcriptional regulator
MTNPAFAPEDTLPEIDARAIARLLGEVPAIEGDIAAQKRHLMEGLCALIGADSWAWATTFRFAPEEVPLSSGFLTGGFDAGQFARFQEAIEHPDTGLLNTTLAMDLEKKQTHITRRLDQIDPAGHFQKSASYPIWIAAGVEHFILSIRPSQSGALSQIALYRRPGSLPFTSRESLITHIILSEVPWLHDDVLSNDLGSTFTLLSSRQRLTLNLLLEGQTRKQISQHLELSPHTIDGYVKEVFRHFGIHSQPELIARFQTGDGGDVA